MSDKCNAEVWILVDAAGDYAVGTSQETAITSYEENIQPLGDSGGYRLVNLTVNVPLPVAVEVEVDVPEQGEPVVTVS